MHPVPANGKPEAKTAVPAPTITTLGIESLYLSENTDNKTAEVENIATKAGPDRICSQS